MKPQILIADDDAHILDAAGLMLKSDFKISAASSVPMARNILAQVPIDVAVVDLNFEGQEEDGLNLIDCLNKKHSEIPIIVLSADQLTRRVVSAMRRDLVDFITKEGDYRQTLKIAIHKGLERRRQKAATANDFQFLTKSPVMKLALQKADKFIESERSCSILITGETGTGKEVLTKYIASRLKKPLIAANMASIGRDTAESELFGHMQGSFTGANRNKIGLIEQAHGGIFFLDELGECSEAVQAKLLRVIQEKEVMPLGGSKPRKIDVQFIGATNRDLDEMVKRKEFRLDLLNRINAFRIQLPPLRERPEDVVLYATQFIEEFTRGKPFHVEPSTFDALMDHEWEGNVRELQNIIEAAVILAPARTLNGDGIRTAIQDQKSQSSQEQKPHLNIREKKRAADVIKALELEGGNRTNAAKRMGIHPATFFRWMNKLGIVEIMGRSSQSNGGKKK
jgi:two-component system response regulator GlrR